MNFTREPIILSIITPKEGCKLVVRNSKGVGQEDYFLDAVEIVLFETITFFRSIEKPKSFLLPTNDYEVLEVKETKMILKNASLERPIKLPVEEEDVKKRGARRRRYSEMIRKTKGGDKNDEAETVSSSTLKPVLPPPNVLIKEKLSRIKSEEFFEENILPGKVEEN